MFKISLRALTVGASLLALTLAGCGGGGSGASSGGVGASAGNGGANPGASNGTAAPALPAIPRVVNDKFALSPLFADHAVLQRDRPLQVWGQAAPGESVAVTLAGRSATAIAGSDGRWMVKMAALGAGGPFVLTAKTADGQTLTRGDIMLGDVWLCSGQSNMEMSFEWNVKDKFAEVAAANYPNIRLLHLPRQTAWSPLGSFDFNDSWQPCRPDSVRSFSAAAYFFGREVHRETGVPIGLVEATWSSTPAQSWVSAAGLQGLGEFRGVLGQNPESGFLERLNRWWRDNDAGTRADWSRLSYDDSSWKTAVLPNRWGAAGINEPVGVVWLRLQVNVPANGAGRDLKWNAGNIGGADTAFWNGAFVGQNVERDKARTYLVPGALVKAGPNMLALRVADNGSGGIAGEMSLQSAGTSEAPIALSGVWKYRVSLAPDRAAQMPQLGALASPESNVVTVAYNGQIAPLQPLGLKGVIWYQGESNIANADGYERLLSALIGDWRGGFQNPNLPFYIAQLASYGAPDETPSDEARPNLQWAQNRVSARVPNTGLAVLNDIGEEAQLHPANKQDVGKRLALLALRDLYGKSVAASGPTLQRFATQGNEIRLTFANAEGGLRLQGDANRVFAIAGGNGRFAWAMPRIEGNEIVLSAAGVSDPRAARFAWSGTPRATLTNGAGLPASLFATDK